MKIISIEAIPIQLPFSAPVRDSLGCYSFSNHGIVIIRDEAGNYGIGEIALAWFGGSHSLCLEVNEYWGQQLIGQSVADVTKHLKTMDALSEFSKRHLLAKAGVEMALLDLLGKSLSMPVYQLLGGRMRERIPLTGGIAISTLDSMVEAAKDKVAEGFTELKLKVGLDDRKDLDLVRQVRKAVPDEVRLRVDANMAWNELKKAKLLIDEMVRLGVHIVEQPLHYSRMNDLRWLREHTDALILLDESVWDIYSAKECLDHRAADLLHVYVTEAGGMIAARRIFELAALYSIECTIGSMPEGRIGASASLHLGIAMSNLSSYASDIRGFLVYREDVVCEELTIRNGELFVSDSPGLGVTLDIEKLEKYRIR